MVKIDFHVKKDVDAISFVEYDVDYVITEPPYSIGIVFYFYTFVLDVACSFGSYLSKIV
jgi:hypothetical protein